MKRFISIVLFLIVVTSMTMAQAVKADYHIGIENGLSNNFIVDLVIDKRGHVWAATESGLNRLAGNIVTLFGQQYMLEEARTNISKEIRSLYYNETTDKVLIGMEKGLFIYNCNKAKFETPQQSDILSQRGINDVTRANDKEVWLLATDGTIWRMNCETQAVTLLRHNNNKGIRCGYDDNNGHLFLGHISEGMSVIDLKSGRQTCYAHQEDVPGSLPGNNVRCIYQDDMRNIWVGTDHGVALFNPVKGTFSKVMHAEKNVNDNVYCIRKLNDGLLWVASDMGGITFIDPRQVSDHERNGTPLSYLTDRQIQVSSSNTRAIVQDSYGNVWVGCHNTGIDFITASKPFFSILLPADGKEQTPRIYGLSADNAGNIWMGGEDAFYLARNGKIIQSWNITEGRRRTHSFVMCLLADSKDNVWLGIEDDGVVRYNRKTNRFERIEIGYAAPDIRALAEDRDGRIWIGSEFGISSYKDGVVDHEEIINQKIGNEHICSILQLPDGRLLLSTLSKGIFFVNTKIKAVTQLTLKDGLPSYRINGACDDGCGGVWLGTQSGLVHIPDVDNPHQFAVYDERQGMRDNNICALLTDRSGRVWLSTFTGISCFNPEKKRFYNYSHTDNLPTGSFISGSATTTSDGYLLFASPNGVCYFNPQSLNNNQKVSDVQIVTFEAYNPAGEDTEILNLVPDKQGQVKTNYKQNTLRIRFAVGDYSQAGRVEYSYMMKGLNNEWYYIDNDYNIVFRGLRPGNYTFILRAKLKSQDWEDAVTTKIEIRITPPFWRSWWAYLLYALLLGLIIWQTIRNYKKKLNLRSSLELERKENMQKQEMNEERLRFFTNITHELRTPLTLILGPLEDLVDDKQIPEVYHRKLEVINKSAGRLRNLINQILEFRKTETQNRRLSVAKGDLGTVVTEVGQYFKQLNRNPQVKVNIHVDDNIPSLYFDSEVIATILNNLLSNAVKYTDRGTIDLSLTQDNQRQAVISVRDTGYGIAPDALPHIFERYYQVKDGHQASGTGIGLALVKSLADLHEGQLWAESKLGEGSVFSFALHIDNNYPHALHKEDEEHKDLEEHMAAVYEHTDDAHPLLLVVEDNADIRQYIADSLGDDYQILQAADGEEGLQLAKSRIPDIIVSDIMMPKMNGIELTKHVKDDISTSHIPVILLTAKDSVEDKEEGYDSGADSYLTKPFSARLLQSRLQNILTNRRRLSELILQRGQNSLTSDAVNTSAELPYSGSKLSRLDQVFIEKLNRVVNENISTTDLDMAFMTDKMAMSHSTFYRKVKALTGMTAKEYIRKLRLQHCVELLKSGDYNVTEAATMTGFNDLGHFREVFRKEFGIAPSDLLKNGVKR